MLKKWEEMSIGWCSLFDNQIWLVWEFEIWGFLFGVLGLGVLNLGFWVWGFGFGVRGIIFNYYQLDLVVK